MALYIGPAWRIGALFLDPIIAEKRVLRGAIRWNLGFGDHYVEGVPCIGCWDLGFIDPTCKTLFQCDMTLHLQGSLWIS